MWRIANCVYRAFRSTATHYRSQDVLIPLSTIYHTDDDELNSKEKEKCSIETKCDIYQILKNNQFSYKNIGILKEYLKLTQKPIETPKAECVIKEETLDSLIKSDETCVNTIKTLSDLHEETMSILNLQLALDALDSGNFQFGIETLQTIAKTGKNSSALYNLGICYEKGIGVEQDRAKACDYYRQASALGHINAQFNLTLLSNHIDINENDDETEGQTLTEKQSPSLREKFFRFLLSNDYKEDQSFNDDQFDLKKNQAIACLS